MDDFDERTFRTLKAGIVSLYRAIARMLAALPLPIEITAIDAPGWDAQAAVRQIERARLVLVREQPLSEETVDQIATVLLIWQTIREAAFLAEHAGLETWRLDAVSEGLVMAVALMDEIAKDLKVPPFTR